MVSINLSAFLIPAILLLLGLLPSWSILSLPNYWLNWSFQVPAKRISILCLIISTALAFIFNIEFTGGIFIAIIYLIFTTSAFAVIVLCGLFVKHLKVKGVNRG